ncbi:CAP domain-containing protein [Ammoniphilus sp. 3BR4]|uniref:CAP domain-containing protein n=1 Tax=Ammoniphilus sp. 3BR4 TaxID=3158265 RepID=UPI0034662974
MKIRVMYFVLSFVFLFSFVSCANADKPGGNESPQKNADETLTVTKSEEKGIYGISLGFEAQKVIERLGQPNRKDRSALGYEWWIYNAKPGSYVQVGILNHKVVDLYSPAASLNFKGLHIGAEKKALFDRFQVKSAVTFEYEGATFTLENQLAERPLIWLEDHPVIFYLDIHNEQRISGIRLIQKDLLVKSRTYALNWSYTGKAPQVEGPSLTPSDQQLVEAGLEKQVLDLANAVRSGQGLTALAWNEKAAQAARSHSADMSHNRYFDHISATTGLNPFDRLKKQGVAYRMAGENIAAGYRDSIEVHHGWMNSLGHRKNILHEGFTTLGVGVKGEYFTQNFVTP